MLLEICITKTMKFYFKLKIMDRQEAENILYDMWENGEIPSNFTEDHSEYETAVKFVMANGLGLYEVGEIEVQMFISAPKPN